MWHNRGAKPGDAIVLTKPLGTGIATSAIKWGICPKGTEEAVIASMARLNANATKAGRGVGISTATDVTGFGLIGHLLEVLEGSGRPPRSASRTSRSSTGCGTSCGGSAWTP